MEAEVLSFKEHFPKWFDRYIVTHSTFAILFLCAHLLYIIFAPQFLQNLAVTFILIVGTSSASYSLGNSLRKLSKTERFQQPAYHMGLMGAGLALVCALGIVPRVLVFFFGWNHYALISSMYLFLWLPLYIYTDTLRFQLIYSKRQKLIAWITLAHIISLIASVRLAIAYSAGWDTVAIISFQMLFFLMSLVASIDMALIIVGAVRWTDGSVNWSRVAPVDVEVEGQEGKKDDAPVIECDICVLPYSTENIPRVLKECGHTVCTDCATRLLAQNKNCFLFCPTCRTATVVRGSAISIPRNHALIGLMEELERKKRVEAAANPSA